MNSFWLYPFIVFAGIMQALGNSMNAQLRNSLQNPWLASLISFLLILAFFVCAYAAMPRPLPTSESIAAMPWWAPFGGLAGAFAVFAGLTMVDKIGAGPFNGMIITANICASLAIDHFGLLNMPIHSISFLRIVGGGLMILGIGLIAKY
jgi:bacterial/archaeal transporter family-2 protein